MRVLTLNVWARSGPYATRAPLLRDGVARLAPDVMALQEVDVGPGAANQAEELFGTLGYEVAFEARPGHYRAGPGIAVASRWPVLDRRLIEMPHGGAALAVRLEAGGEGFWLCNAVPMRPWPGQEGEREAEAIVLDEELTKLATGDARPPILAGDFDAPPDSASMRFLTGLQSLHGHDTAWYDAWTVAGDGSPGYTWTSDNGYVAPFAEAVFAQPVHHRRIDYVLVGSPFRWRPRVVVRSCEVVLTGDGDAAPSDHYGVLADLDLDGVTLGDGRGLEAWPDVERRLWGSGA